jgi:hypothetical protein
MSGKRAREKRAKTLTEDDVEQTRSRVTRYKADLTKLLRKPGRTRRPKRDLTQIELRAERMRRAFRRKGRPFDEEKVIEKAITAWAILVARLDAPDASRRNPVPAPQIVGVHPLVMHAAKVRSRYGQEIRAKLRDRNDGGREAAEHAINLAAAVVERNLYENLPVEVKRAWTDFECEARPLQEWAYGDDIYPSEAQKREHEKRVARGETKPGHGMGRSLPNINGLISGKTETIKEDEEQEDGSVKQVKRKVWIPGVLDRVDPTFLESLTVEAWLELHQSGKWPDYGTAMSIDGTRLPVARDHRQSASLRDDMLMNGRFAQEECAYGYHGDGEGWRGFNGMFLSDAIGPPFAPVQELPPANCHEPDYVAPLLDKFYSHVGDDWTRLKVLIGDKAFFSNATCEMLTFRFGLMPLFPWHPSMAAVETRQVINERKVEVPDWSHNMGVPQCTCGGFPRDMKYIECTPWYGPEKRRELGLRPGQDIRPILVQRKLDWPRVRYQCKACKKRVDLFVHWAPAVYTYFPYKDVHSARSGHASRYQVRMEYLVRRGGAESLNNALKYRCFGLAGTRTARCIKSRNQMLWYAYGRNLSLILERLLYVNGAFTTTLEAVRGQRLDEPGLLRRLRDAGHMPPDPLPAHLLLQPAAAAA